MKYNRYTLDGAISFLLPKISDAMDRGVNFDRPSLIDMVAKDYFAKSFNPEYVICQKERIAYEIVAQAFNDLEKDGYFTFGNFGYFF